MSPGDTNAIGVGFELIDLSVIADGVVIGDLAGGLGTEHRAQVESLRDRSEGGVGIPRLYSEASGILGDEYLVEVSGGFNRVSDVVVVQFCDQPVLK